MDIKKRSKMRKRTIIAVTSIALTIIIPIVILFADFDGDGLSTLAELGTGTDMFSSDTDGDGIKDGLEVNTYGTNPFVSDTDNDGLSDKLEIDICQTNPVIEDSDDDGLDDGVEVLGSFHIFGLESTAWSDIFYSWTLQHKIWDNEIDNYVVYHSWQGLSWTWPYHYENILMGSEGYVSLMHVTSDPLSIDTDGDGLDDITEYTIGTNPQSKDTDNDGLDDIDEFTIYNTIPQFYDTDGDLLGDWEEINTYLTNSLDPDSDNDHLIDGIEVKGYDVDDDNIIDVDFPARGANPLVKDIFVEVDWMPPRNRLSTSAKNRLVEVFGEHNIVLHIDDNEMDGGSETEEVVEVYSNKEGPMNDLHDFMEKYFTPSRRGTFYWCLIATRSVYIGTGEVGGFNLGDIFIVGDRPSIEIGPAFMHELGHGLGLGSDDFDGIDSEKYTPYYYRSVMNYNTPSDFYGYSDGPLFNDWEHLDFEWLPGRIQV